MIEDFPDDFILGFRSIEETILGPLLKNGARLGSFLMYRTKI